MRTNRTHHSTHPEPSRRHLSLAAALGVVLAACLGGAVRAEVIDDFEHGYQFWANGGGAGSHVEIIDGQLHLTAPPDGAINVGYMPVHSIPETGKLTFTVDVISMSSTTWSAGLICEFTTAPEHAHSSSLGGYGAYRMSRSLRIAKWWAVGDSYAGLSWLAEMAMPALGAPETVSLSLTRQGDSLQLLAQSVRRATGEVLASVSFLDTPNVDQTLGLADQDNGPPFLELTRNVAFGISGTVNGTGEVVIDNLVCSNPPVIQQLAIERASENAAALAWDGEAVLLQSTSSLGPWVPCIAEAGNSESRFTTQVPFLDSHRFFALGVGHYFASRFDDLGPWHTAQAVVGAPGGNLGLRVSAGQASAYGSHLGDRDFLVRWGVTGFWWGDCVASVDILGWEPTMAEGTTFGIVLRAKPQNGVWLIEEEGLPENRYIGLLTFKKPGSPGESTLSITGPDGERLRESTIPAVDPQHAYRLRFWAVGEQLKLELCDTDDVATAIATCEASDDRCPTGIEALFVKPSPSGSTQILFDNFQLWGVFAPAEWQVEAP